LDFEVLRQQLPPNVEPAFDGMRVLADPHIVAQKLQNERV
jgi:hypothetical protein